MRNVNWDSAAIRVLIMGVLILMAPLQLRTQATLRLLKPLQQTAGLPQNAQWKIDTRLLQEAVVRRAENIRFSLPLASGNEIVLDMHLIAPPLHATNITAITTSGSVSVLDPVLQYRAKIAGTGFAVVTISESMMLATIETNTAVLHYGPSKNASDPDRYDVAEVAQAPFTCHTATDNIGYSIRQAVNNARSSKEGLADALQSQDTLTLEIAVETDYDLFVEFDKNQQRVSTYIQQLIAVLSTVYERDLRVRLVTSNIRMWTVESNSYPYEASVFELLGLFVDEYRANMKNVHRDIAVFLTARGGQGGIARTIGGLCQEDGSYCAGDIVGNVQPYPTWTWDVGMLAHEIGHVCGAIHTQSCYWPGGPLDSCIQSESGTCVSNDQTRPARGTIMSYCFSQLQYGGTVELEFHPLHRVVIRSYIEQASCVGSVPSPLDAKLRCRVLDAKTGEPLEGVSLRVVAKIDHLYRQTPIPSGSSSLMSDANGEANFIGLGYGLYTVVVEAPFISMPLNFSAPSSERTVVVADTSVEITLLLARGRPVRFAPQVPNDSLATSIALFSNEFATLSETLTQYDTAWSVITSPITRVLPAGTYYAVPSTSGRVYTPSKVEFTVVPFSDTLILNLASVSASNPGLVAISCYVGALEMGTSAERTLRLKGGMSCTVKDISTQQTIATSTIPSDGVLVFESYPNIGQYYFEVEYDTSLYAPMASNPYAYPEYGVYGGNAFIQARRIPFVARPFVFSRYEQSYVPLESPTILRSPATIGPRHIVMALPFRLQYSDRVFDYVTIMRNGYVTLGKGILPQWLQAPLGHLSEMEMIIAPFAVELELSESNSRQPHIAWKVVGTGANRACVIEWHDLSIRYLDSDSGTVDHVGAVRTQLWLFESGRIEMMYQMSTDFDEMLNVQVGLRGNDIFDNNVVYQRSSTDWSNVDADYRGQYASTLVLNRASIPPGLTYRWNPVSLSVDELLTTEITLIPNPATSEVVLNGVNSDAVVRVVDVLGSAVFTTNISPESQRIDVRSLAVGRYSVVIQQGETITSLPLLILR